MPRWILSNFPTHLAHLMDPLVKARTLLKREVPPSELEGLVPGNLLPCRYKTSDVLGFHMIALVVGDGVHSGRGVEERRRER